MTCGVLRYRPAIDPVNDQPLKGALLLVLGEGLLAVMAAMIKHLSDHLDTEVIVFARNLFGLLILIPIIASVAVLANCAPAFYTCT